LVLHHTDPEAYTAFSVGTKQYFFLEEANYFLPYVVPKLRLYGVLLLLPIYNPME
jgi:hypothetical protein